MGLNQEQLEALPLPVTVMVPTGGGGREQVRTLTTSPLAARLPVLVDDSDHLHGTFRECYARVDVGVLETASPRLLADLEDAAVLSPLSLNVTTVITPEGPTVVEEDWSRTATTVLAVLGHRENVTVKLAARVVITYTLRTTAPHGDGDSRRKK